MSNLQPSSMAIPGYTPKGTLYQADITARSDGGIVTPMVNDFIARGPNGQNYRVIDKVEAPNGLNPAPIAQGSESTGTLYFDVTGAPPNGVVYNDGMQDILMWTSNVPGAYSARLAHRRRLACRTQARHRVRCPARRHTPNPDTRLIRLQIPPRAMPIGAGRFAFAGVPRG